MLHEFPALLINAQSGLDQGFILKTLTHRTRSSDSSEQDWAVRQHEFVLMVTRDSCRTLQFYIIESSVVFYKYAPTSGYFMLVNFSVCFTATLMALV